MEEIVSDIMKISRLAFFEEQFTELDCSYHIQRNLLVCDLNIFHRVAGKNRGGEKRQSLRSF